MQVFICVSQYPVKSGHAKSFVFMGNASSYSHRINGISICTWRVEFKVVELVLWVLLNSYEFGTKYYYVDDDAEKNLKLNPSRVSETKLSVSVLIFRAEKAHTTEQQRQ